MDEPLAAGDWPQNYFNYFTETEEHFQQARGTGLFRLSPLDWALIEAWKNAGVPLEAVLRGIDTAFEKWRKKKVRSQMVNSLAFCAQAVMREAELLAAAATGQPAPSKPADAPFPASDLRHYLERNAQAVAEAGHSDIAEKLRVSAADAEEHLGDLESLEQELTALEAMLVARLTTQQSAEELLVVRQELDAELRPYRGKMSAPQLAMLERQYLERRLLDRARLPRLSLFYLT